MFSSHDIISRTDNIAYWLHVAGHDMAWPEIDVKSPWHKSEFDPACNYRTIPHIHCSTSIGAMTVRLLKNEFEAPTESKRSFQRFQIWSMQLYRMWVSRFVIGIVCCTMESDYTNVYAIHYGQALLCTLSAEEEPSRPERPSFYISCQ